MSARSTRSVAFVIYDGIQSLDLSGPLEVFAMANWSWAQAHPAEPPPYTIRVLAHKAGPVVSSSGLTILAQGSYFSVASKVDTLIVAGGEAHAAACDTVLLNWLRRTAPRVRRLASVCSGAFILAQAGLLDGRRATTHWSVVPLLAGYPAITVEPDAIFVRDGKVYTSAGVTAGIDLALALVEEDLGHDLALAVARRLVVFLKRPGGQSQFSGHLAAQTPASGLLGDLPEWMLEHLGENLVVEALSARAGMSPRNFARVFLKELGMTPAKFVEKARLDVARRLLEDSTLGLEEVSLRCGFASGEHMRRTFHRHLKILPQDYRKRFQPRRTQQEVSALLPPSHPPEGETPNDRKTRKDSRRNPLPRLRAARRVWAA